MITATILEELAGSTSSRFSQRAGINGARNAVLGMTEDYCVIPDLFPLVDRHSLLVTREFELNLLLNSQESRGAEVRQLMNHAVSTLCLPGEGLIFFEHGVAVNRLRPICGTVHAHVHMIPLPEATISAILIDFATYAAEQQFESNLGPECNQNDLEHIKIGFVIGPLSKKPIECYTWWSKSFESQLLRRFIGEWLKVSWNWKVASQSDECKVMSIHAAFVSNQNVARNLEKSLSQRSRMLGVELFTVSS